MTTLELCSWFVVITTVLWLNHCDAIFLPLNQLLRLIMILKCWKICFLLFLYRIYAVLGDWANLLWIVDDLNIIHHRDHAIFFSCDRSLVVHFMIRALVTLKQIFEITTKWMVPITAAGICILFSGSIRLHWFLLFHLFDLIQLLAYLFCYFLCHYLILGFWMRW